MESMFLMQLRNILKRRHSRDCHCNKLFYHPGKRVEIREKGAEIMWWYGLSNMLLWIATIRILPESLTPDNKEKQTVIV